MEFIVTSQENLEAIVKNAVQQAVGILTPKNVELKKNLSFPEGLALLNENGYQVSKSQLYKATMTDTVPCKHFGRKVVFSPDELLEWAEAKTKRKAENPVAAAVAQSATKKMGRVTR